jgi:hypothetical protein
MAAESETPVLRIVNADATPEEIAAIVAVFAAAGSAGSAGGAASTKPVREWAAPGRLVRRTPLHGPGGWRASGLPR